MPALAGVLSPPEGIGEVVGEAVELLSIGANVVDDDGAVEVACGVEVDVYEEEDEPVDDEDVLATAEEVIVLCTVEETAVADEDDAAAVVEVEVAAADNSTTSGQHWIFSDPFACAKLTTESCLPLREIIRPAVVRTFGVSALFHIATKIRVLAKR